MHQVVRSSSPSGFANILSTFENKCLRKILGITWDEFKIS